MQTALVFTLATACPAQPPAGQAEPAAGGGTAEGHAINAMVDIAHQFTFYFDGRFGRAYLAGIGGRDARLWAAIGSSSFLLLL